MSWEQLKAILEENSLDAREQAGRPPEVCPIDGELLVVGKYGVRNCPLGNFTHQG